MAIDLESRTSKATVVDASINNIPTSYSTAAGSLILTGVRYATGIGVLNFTDSRIMVNYGDGNGMVVPSNDQMLVPAKGGGQFAAKDRDDIKLAANIYIRAFDGSPITTGEVEIEVW